MPTMSPRRVQDAVTPLNGYLAVRGKEPKSNSPIYIPKSTTTAPSLAEVVAVAKDVLLIKAGDTVIVPKYAGSIVQVDGEDLLFIKATDILGKVAE